MFGFFDKIKDFFIGVIKYTLGTFVVAMAIIMFIFRGIFAFVIGYFVGWTLQYFGFAYIISDGFNLVFNTVRFTAENLTLVLGTLGLLAALFKPNLSVQKES